MNRAFLTVSSGLGTVTDVVVLIKLVIYSDLRRTSYTEKAGKWESHVAAFGSLANYPQPILKKTPGDLY